MTHVWFQAICHFRCVFLCINIFCYTYISLYRFLYIFWYITMSTYVYIKNNRPNMICCWWMNVIGSDGVWRHNSFPIFSPFSQRKWTGPPKFGPMYKSLILRLPILAKKMLVHLKIAQFWKRKSDISFAWSILR